MTDVRSGDQGAAVAPEDATPGDAAAIVRIFRGGFEDELRDVTLYSAHGAARFVEDQLRLGSASSYRYAVVRERGRVIAAAELRRRAPVLFLSYVAVEPDVNRRGIGRALLRAEIARGLAEGLTVFELDVFASNTRAARLYERMGLRATSERGIWTRPLRSGGGGARPLVHDHPQAECVHARFGFSELSITVDGADHRVGRLGHRFFRLSGARAAEDEALLRALAALDPAREALAFVEGACDPASVPGWRLLVVSRRMSGQLAELTP